MNDLLKRSLDMVWTCVPGHTADSLETVRSNVLNQRAVLVDVREQHEWDAGHIEGAILMPLSQLHRDGRSESLVQQITRRLGKKKIVYIHCAVGGRVLMANGLFKKLGYDARPLKAGYEDLLKVGFNKE